MWSDSLILANITSLTNSLTTTSGHALTHTHTHSQHVHTRSSKQACLPAILPWHCCNGSSTCILGKVNFGDNLFWTDQNLITSGFRNDNNEKKTIMFRFHCRDPDQTVFSTTNPFQMRAFAIVPAWAKKKWGYFGGDAIKKMQDSIDLRCHAGNLIKFALECFFRLIDFSYHGSYYYFLQTAILEFSGKGQLPLVAVSRRTNPNNCLFRNWDERLMAFGANGSLTGRLKSVEQVLGKKASLKQQQQLQTIG